MVNLTIEKGKVMLRVLRPLEPLLCRLNVGKPPTEAGNFIRSEQLWFNFNRCVATRAWMPKPFVARATSVLQHFAITIGNRAIMGHAIRKFGMRPTTPDELKTRPLEVRLAPPSTGFVAYSEPVKLPARWLLIGYMFDLGRTLRRLRRK
jgi:hypothetical protein